MSKDYTEFKDIETPEKNDYGEEKETNIVSLESAKEEINAETEE